MKSEKTLVLKTAAIVMLTIAAFTSSITALRPINSIVTTSITSAQVTRTHVKGAGLRTNGSNNNNNSGNGSNGTGNSGNLISYCDSTGTDFTVKYNAPSTANSLRLQQFTANGITSVMDLATGQL